MVSIDYYSLNPVNVLEQHYYGGHDIKMISTSSTYMTLTSNGIPARVEIVTIKECKLCGEVLSTELYKGD